MIRKVSAQKAFKMGQDAFDIDPTQKDTSNPFPKGTTAYKEYERGYNTSFFMSLDRVQHRERRKISA